MFIHDETFKLEKGPTDKAKEPDPGGSDQQNLGYKQLKNRKTDRTVRLNPFISNISEEVRPCLYMMYTISVRCLMMSE